MRNFLLSTTRYFEKENEQGSDKEKTPVEKQREEIDVANDKKEEEKKEEDVKEKDEDGKVEDEEDESEESGEDDKEDDKKELTPEQKVIQSLEKKIARLERRTGKTAGERDQLKKDLAAAKTQLDAKVTDSEGLTEEEVERRAEIKATEKSNQREFEKAQAKLLKDAKAVDKDFQTKVNEMAQDVAPIPSFFIGALEDMDNGGAVLAYLANNVDEYEQYFKDELTPVQVVRRLTKISDKLIEEGKVQPKKISKVPDPPEKNIRGNQGSPNVLNDKMDMDDWVRVRNQQEADKRKLRQR